MPSRLEGYHAEVEEGWLEATQRPSKEVLRVAIALGHSAPPGVLERTLSACQGLGCFERVWKTGAHLVAHSLKDVTNVLFKLRSVAVGTSVMQLIKKAAPSNADESFKGASNSMRGRRDSGAGGAALGGGSGGGGGLGGDSSLHGAGEGGPEMLAENEWS